STSGASALTTPGYLHRGLDELFRMARETPIDPACDSFHFIRHGETEGNAKRIFQHAEIPLNARGLAQAEAASRALANAKLQRIMASTMTRAWTTAEIIGKPHGLTPIAEPGLRERWFGDLVGTPSHDHDWRDSPPNGETLAGFVTRTQAGIRRSLEHAARERTALVGHGGILYVLAPSFGLDITTEMLANATPLRFERRSGNTWSVTRVADVGASGDNIS
ncbi:MAG: histidine phosphatase family protein, partial [Proteobacteria bacterium]|nr:histidine phosphatase family protein [Pseudomonadota bacterium]